MLYLAIKTLLTAGLIVAISELSRQSPFWGGVLASLPLVSILAMVWMHHETRDPALITQFATSVFWLVLPSLVLFLLLPWLLKKQWDFYPALGLASVATVAAYAGLVFLLGRMGLKF